MRPFPLRSARNLILVLGAALVAPLAAAPSDVPFELVKRDASLARAEANIGVWRERIAQGRPRIFITPAEWSGLPARYEASEGVERTRFDAIIDRARVAVQKPVTAYRPPEEYVSASNALPSAQAELWQRPIGDNLVALCFAYKLTGDEAIRDKLRETVLTVCRYPSWGLLERKLHLTFGHVARGIAVAYDWHHDIWSEEEKVLIRDVMRTRVNEACAGLYGARWWSNAYQVNHNHVPAAAIGLSGLAFLDDIPEAAEWTAAGLANFENVVRYGNRDGSLPEGLSYWSYAMTFILQYIEGARAVLGTDSLYDSPFLKNVIQHRLHASTSGFGSVVQWGDASTWEYGPAHMMWRLAAQYRDSGGQYLGDSMQVNRGGGGDVLVWMVLWRDPTLVGTPPQQLDSHREVVDLVSTRSGWDSRDYMLSLKSGINNQPHSHLDAGALALAFGDEWLLKTSGYGTGKTKGTLVWQSGGAGGRWTFFANATESQSALLINGANQSFAPDARGTVDTFVSADSWCWAGVDLTGVYQDINYVRRDVLHRRGDYLLVFDRVDAPRAVTVEWLAQVPGPASGAVVTTVESGVKVQGTNGASLEVRPVLPGGPAFTLREPTSTHYDLPKGRQLTYALKTEGSNTRSVVALLPARADESSSVVDFVAVETAGGLNITVQGNGWTDHIVVENHRASAVRTPTDGAAEPAFTLIRSQP